MSVLHLLALVEPAIALGIALLASAVVTRRRQPEVTRRRVLVAVAGVAVLALFLVFRLWSSSPWFHMPGWWDTPYLYRTTSYLLPLAAGAVLVVVAGWPIRGRHAPGRAALERRGILTAARPGWLVGVALLVVIAVSVAIAAGLASSPDENGDYTLYDVPVGAGMSGGTMIYGWYFSAPSGVGALVLLIAFVSALAVVSRSALRVDPALEEVIRHGRARDVTAATAGALLLHLGTVFTSLRGTASLTMTFSIDSGAITVVGPFSALGPALGVAGAVSTVLGFALWWFVVLAAIRARRIPVSA